MAARLGAYCICPAAVWAAWTEFTGTICPLTPWEQALRQQAGQAGIRGGFVDHYLVPVLYPAALTPGIQIALGAVVVDRQCRHLRRRVAAPAAAVPRPVTEGSHRS